MGHKYISKLNEPFGNLYKSNNIQFEVHELSEYLKKKDYSEMEFHVHDLYQIIWFKSGEGKHYIDSKEYNVSANSIFFIAKNQVHHFDSNTEYMGALISFNESFLLEQNSEIERLLRSSLFYDSYQNPLCYIRNNVDNMLNEYLKLIKNELKNENIFGQRELLWAYLKAFLIQIQRGKNEYKKVEGKGIFLMNEKRMRLIQYINLIDKNFPKGLTIAEYADLLEISVKTLYNLTSELLDKNPSSMIQERVILEIQRLLLYSNLNVDQIGYRLGFDDPSYFVKYFKKYTKVSPTEFRKTAV